MNTIWRLSECDLEFASKSIPLCQHIELGEEGTRSSLFLYSKVKENMLKKAVKTKIKDLLLKKFEEEGFKQLFLIDVTVNERSGFIRAYLDGDNGISFENCQKISRYLESYLDEDDDVSEKYTLEVSSPGVKRPLSNLRQFPQHVGRVLSVTLKGQKSKNLVLKDVKGSELLFESQPSKKKKKKGEQIETIKADFDEIDEAIVKISFN